MSNEEQAPDVSAAGDAAAEQAAAASAEAEKAVTAAGGPPPAPAGEAEEEGVEYVYEDEHGNPIAPPEAGLNPDEYEVVETVEEPGAAPAGAPAEASAAPEAAGEKVSDTLTPKVSDTFSPPAAETRRLTAPSSRRAGDRKSARQPKQMTPEELKKVRLKVLLLLGLIGLIPLLMIAIAVTWYFRHYRPRQRARQNPVVRVEQNAYDKGAGLFSSASPQYDNANRLYDAGKRAEALKEYRACEAEFDKALKLIEKWIQDQKNPDDYAQVQMTARDIRIKLRNVRERLIMLEATPPTPSPAPPAPPAPAPAPAPPSPAAPSPGETETP